MKLCHIFFCSIFLYLQDGNTGLNDETPVYEGVEGGNITVTCKFYIPGSKTLFCKDQCKKGNILIETPDYTAQSGRYSIEYEKDNFLTPIVHVSITQLSNSDSGRYSCRLDTSFEPCDFQLVITGGLNCRRHSAYDHTEIGLSEIDRPVSSCEDSTYQSLNTASRDHDQTYSTLRHNNQFSDMNSC
ncbi:uncharacterized protein LOC106097303 isoform X2 [Oreochromis niloticus]|uniref:uncharacterized protein LOC106097303 isoform X2 n=1 Tax=Oreochromis niloticus TaxID=8128 RepID=UPI000DF3BFF9|nr:uncharacterized protein LOC106097303 isoform X2 [Oreochromis niloticus]